jgi:glutaredoxin
MTDADTNSITFHVAILDAHEHVARLRHVFGETNHQRRSPRLIGNAIDVFDCQRINRVDRVFRIRRNSLTGLPL